MDSSTRLTRRIALLGLVALFAIAGFFLWPTFVGHLKDLRHAAHNERFGHRPGEVGLIYVESPEVYTRQRLVNDRYLQDAWLRDQLERVDDPSAAWLDEAQEDMQNVVLGVIAGAGDNAPAGKGKNSNETAPELTGEVIRQLTQIPFETRFRLQTEARDKIRQMILENALDDRHDLSGNTVFGLKFDTSILPGTEARLNPTVIVRMDEAPIEKLLSPKTTTVQGQEYTGTSRERCQPEDFVKHFLLFADRETDAPVAPYDLCSNDHTNARALLSQIDGYFDDWVKSIERRIQKRIELKLAAGGENAVGPAVPLVEQDVCAPDPLQGGYTLTPAAQNAIQALFESKKQKALDHAIGYVTRNTDVGETFLRSIPQRLLNNAPSICRDHIAWQASEKEQNREIGPLLISDLVRDFSGSVPQSMPGAWGQYFGIYLEHQPVDGSYREPLDVSFELPPQTVTIYILNRGEFPPFEVPLHPLFCGEEICRSLDVYFATPDSMPPEAIERTRDALNSRLVAAIVDATRTHEKLYDVCFFVDQSAPVVFEVGTAEELDDYCKGATTVVGRQISLRLGAYEFFRSMAEVETYTYAAFPRGDVSGVVRETSRAVGVQGALGANGFGGLASFGRESRGRDFEAVPSVINFATGQSRVASLADDEASAHTELFDFGWSVVKSGAKEPMMVSQLVLVSVPAYLREIKLTLWKGFLNPDTIPTDRAARVFEPASDAPGNGDMRSFNDLSFDEKVDVMMVGVDKRTITLNVPQDFSALDRIVVGRNEIYGPRIDVLRFFEDADEAFVDAPETLKPVCPVEVLLTASEVDGDPSTASRNWEFDLVIPGDRLWRSTVVTLGERKAHRIEVMPDMRGILATFRFPYNEEKKTDRKSWHGEHTLSVWTSEGYAETQVEIGCGLESD